MKTGKKDTEKTVETRFVPFGECELRAQVSGDGKKKTIVGYAAVFNKWGSEAYGFREQIAPGAFAATLKEPGRNIRACFNHDPNLLLGTTANGTARFDEDQRGLFDSIDVNENDPNAMSVWAKIDRGDVTGQSFSFVTKKDHWEYPENGLPERTLLEVELREAGPVTFPFYEMTDVDVALRSMEANRPETAPEPGGEDEAGLIAVYERDLELDEEENPAFEQEG